MFLAVLLVHLRAVDLVDGVGVLRHSLRPCHGEVPSVLHGVVAPRMGVRWVKSKKEQEREREKGEGCAKKGACTSRATVAQSRPTALGSLRHTSRAHEHTTPHSPQTPSGKNKRNSSKIIKKERHTLSHLVGHNEALVLVTGPDVIRVIEVY